jgi:hypothetical protein
MPDVRLRNVDKLSADNEAYIFPPPLRTLSSILSHASIKGQGLDRTWDDLTALMSIIQAVFIGSFMLCVCLSPVRECLLSSVSIRTSVQLHHRHQHRKQVCPKPAPSINGSPSPCHASIAARRCCIEADVFSPHQSLHQVKSLSNSINQSCNVITPSSTPINAHTHANAFPSVSLPPSHIPSKNHHQK